MAISENATYLNDLFDPQVVGDMIDKKLIDLIRFAPLCEIDTTLVGRPGSTLTLPYYTYIGAAEKVNEGADIPIGTLGEDTVEVPVYKIGKGVQITDEAALSGYGDPLGESVTQIAMAIADKVEGDLVTILGNIAEGMTHACSGALATADDVADALVLFGEDFDGQKVLLCSPAQYNAFRKADDWVPASEIAGDLIIRGTVGMIYGCQIIVSNRLATSGNLFIVKPGALKLLMKRDTLVESDRDIVNKSTVLTGDKHFAPYLYDASKAIKLTVNPNLLTVEPIAGTETVLNKTVSDVQTGVEVGNTSITGTLKYVTGWTDYSGDPELQDGNFICIHAEAEDADAITVELVGGEGDPTTLDSDGNAVIRITNKDTQTLRYVASKLGGATTTLTYSLSGLVLETE